MRVWAKCDCTLISSLQKSRDKIGSSKHGTQSVFFSFHLARAPGENSHPSENNGRVEVSVPSIALLQRTEDNVLFISHAILPVMRHHKRSGRHASILF